MRLFPEAGVSFAFLKQMRVTEEDKVCLREIKSSRSTTSPHESGPVLYHGVCKARNSDKVCVVYLLLSRSGRHRPYSGRP